MRSRRTESETREKFTLTRRTESEGHAAVAVAVIGGVVPVATRFRGLESPSIFATAHYVAPSRREGIVGGGTGGMEGLEGTERRASSPSGRAGGLDSAYHTHTHTYIRT